MVNVRKREREKGGRCEGRGRVEVREMRKSDYKGGIRKGKEQGSDGGRLDVSERGRDKRREREQRGKEGK